ncbi:MAG: hypothetical protein U1F33_00155 [Alphaproteobacteria bacterium]
MRTGWAGIHGTLAALLILGTPALACAQDDGRIDYFDPLVSRSPAPERELDVGVSHQKGGDGRFTTISGDFTWSFDDKYQLTLSTPIGINDPRNGSARVGFGDVGLEGQYVFFSAPGQRALAAMGLALTMPSGSANRGLGGQTVTTPFITGALARGDFQLIGEVNYALTGAGPTSGAQTFTANAALGYTAFRGVTPLVELSLVRQTHAADQAFTSDGTSNNLLLNRTQAYATPGFEVKLAERVKARAGVQLPLTSSNARQFDYNIISAFTFEF